METQTVRIPKWLFISVLVLGTLCVAAIIVLTVLLCTLPAGEPEAAVPPQPTEQMAAAPAPTEPLLDLELSTLTPADFAYRGQYRTCTAVPCKIGIDVSAWQNEINWTLVGDVGMEFAMIRMAWRGNTEGSIQEDAYARANYQGAKEAGLEVGAYFFSQAITPEEAVEEAEFLLEMIQDWQIDMPIVFDWERSGNRTADTDARTVTDCAKAFCQTIEEAGYEAMVYFNLRQAYHEMYLEELDQYGFWLAQYNEEITFPYAIDMWQYTSSGSVLGVNTSVDLNLWFTD